MHSSKPPRPLSSYICEEGSQSAVDDDGGKNWKGKRSHSSMDYNQMPDTHSPQQPGKGVGVVKNGLSKWNSRQLVNFFLKPLDLKCCSTSKIFEFLGNVYLCIIYIPVGIGRPSLVYLVKI